jgi:hypothetical protein
MKTPHEHIAVAAYLLWEAAGRVEGCDIYFWLEAEYQLAHEYGKHHLRVCWPKGR